MKKKTVIMVVAIVVVLLLGVVGGFYLIQNREKSMLSMSKSKIEKIVITNGNNGNMLELQGEKVDELYEKLSNTKMKKTSDEKSSGWQYSIDVCGKDSDTDVEITLISMEKCKISGDCYSIAEDEGKELISYIESLDWK